MVRHSRMCGCSATTIGEHPEIRVTSPVLTTWVAQGAGRLAGPEFPGHDRRDTGFPRRIQHGRDRMLASMSESGLQTEPLNGSDLGMNELPTGTVSLLLAD